MCVCDCVRDSALFIDDGYSYKRSYYSFITLQVHVDKQFLDFLLPISVYGFMGKCCTSEKVNFSFITNGWWFPSDMDYLFENQVCVWKFTWNWFYRASKKLFGLLSNDATGIEWLFSWMCRFSFVACHRQTSQPEYYNKAVFGS